MQRIGFCASDEPEARPAPRHASPPAMGRASWEIHITGDDTGFHVEMGPQRPARIVKELAFVLASSPGLRAMLTDAVNFSAILVSADEDSGADS